jgi:hypothetical protein
LGEKKEAGKAVTVAELPRLPQGTPTDVDIYPSPPQPQEPAPIQAVVAAAEASASAVTIPETLEDAHPMVKAWLAQHKGQQAEREREHKRRRRDEWSWVEPLLADLTKRDLYRFRVTSALFPNVVLAARSTLRQNDRRQAGTTAVLPVIADRRPLTAPLRHAPP